MSKMIGRRIGIAAILWAIVVVLARPSSPGEPERYLVIYTAEWCKPCQKLKKDLEENPGVLRGMAVEWRDGAEVGSVPDIRLMEEGRVIRQKVGYTGLKSFVEWLNADLL